MQNEDLKKLAEPFPLQDIEFRLGATLKDQKKGLAMPYVTNRAIMNRLDEVCGAGDWKDEYKEWRVKAVLCGISIRVDGEWITKWDGSDETNMEGTKGGFSSAEKRAAVKWGIGRYLYDLEPVWVKIEQRGKSWIIAMAGEPYSKMREQYPLKTKDDFKPKQSLEQAESSEVVDTISSDQEMELNTLTANDEGLFVKILGAYNIESFKELPESEFSNVKKRISDYQKRKAVKVNGVK